QADPELKEKIKEERSGILAWLVQGCLAWQELGLAIPASISLATEKYRDEEDRILHFLNECCVIQSEVSVKASALYEAYKAWCEENQFGRGMNATLFGNEISRRFQKKRGHAGIVYQGIGLLTTHEDSVGLVSTSSPSENDDERPSEASLQPSENTESVGCVGFHQVFSQNAIESLSIGQNWEKPYTPYTSSTIVDSYDIASEANAEQKNVDSQPYTNPTLVRQYVETADGLGYLTGNQREQDVAFIADDERKARLRYKIGVVLLKDGVERFYYPQNTWQARQEIIRAYEQSCEMGP
ncbi:MAG TPA: primase-like DNA-binding domain-containing protein, partial [Ktedonobacteraceae bacterium]